MQHIFTLDINCISGMYLTEPYEFRIQVPATWTLADLANYLLLTMEFDGDHLAQYYLAATPSGRKTWFGSAGGTERSDLSLNKIFPLPKHKKLFYLYDFGASWKFKISKQGKVTTAIPGIEYPCLLATHGTKPLEYGDDGDSD
jgi:hypothetical protein